MKKSAKKSVTILAGFLIFFGTVLAAENRFELTERPYLNEGRSVGLPNADTWFNPLGIPELQPQYVIHDIKTADDPRFEASTNPHKVPFVPASELRPPETAESIPIFDSRPEHYYDLNEWEEDRLFSSNLYTDTSIYTTGIDGDKALSTRNKGEFYEQNLRYELFTSRSDGDSLAVSLDTTHTNDKRPYRDGFTLNQLSIDSRTARSQLVVGHAFPQMSEFSMTQNVLGLYGVQDFDYTTIKGFAGYYALEKDDLKNPRYIGGFRIEHERDPAVRIGFNLTGVNDERDNAGATFDLPAISNRLYSFDVNLKPTDKFFFDAEIAHSDTDFDKNDDRGDQKGNAYRVKTGYEQENARFEAGVEGAETAFISPLGQSPRDERAYFAGVFYRLNQYISGRFNQRLSRDNIQSYQRSTIVRDQPEIQLTLTPSEYYKDLRIDFSYQPLHEFSEDTGFMDRYIDMLWVELNHQAGEMVYYLSLNQTIDKDDVNVLNDRDIHRFDFNLTWEYDSFRRVYSSVSIEKLNYKRAGGKDQTEIYGFGGTSKFHDDIYIGLDLMREIVNPVNAGAESTHDRINLSLTREYSPATRLILDLEGNRSEFTTMRLSSKDYTARLRFLRAF